MKSPEELEMSRTQAEVRRLKKELAEAKEKADVAWRAYVREGRPGDPVRAVINPRTGETEIDRHY